MKFAAAVASAAVLALSGAALDRAVAWLGEQGWTVRETTDSPIVGGDGNREYLVWARRD